VKQDRAMGSLLLAAEMNEKRNFLYVFTIYIYSTVQHY